MTVTEAKEPRSAKPGTLLSQWWTLGAIAADRRTKGRHTAVAWVIIDRFMQKKGNGRASIRYLEKATGLSQNTIIKAYRELVEWGYFTQHISPGTRPAEYTPKWLVLHPSTALATAAPICSSTASPMCSATDSSASPTCSESCLPEPAYQPASLVSSNDSAAPASPPHAAGLAPSSGEAPQEERARDTQAGGFDELWATYRFKHDRAKAKIAYAKLSPSPELHAELCTAAAAWADHYETNGTEPRWRVRLHNWLGGEKYLEDVPQVYADAKSAAISKTRGSAKANSARCGKPRKTPGPVTARITAANVVQDGSTSELRFTTTDGDGAVLDHVITLEHHDGDTQCEGQKQLGKLVGAAGLGQIEDSAELLGRTIVLTGDKYIYAAPIVRPVDDASLSSASDTPISEPPPSSPLTEAELAEIKARVAAAPPMPRRREFSLTEQRQAELDAEAEAEIEVEDEVVGGDLRRRPIREITVEEYEAHAGVPFEEDDDWPDWMDAEQEDDAA